MHWRLRGPKGKRPEPKDRMQREPNWGSRLKQKTQPFLQAAMKTYMAKQPKGATERPLSGAGAQPKDRMQREPQAGKKPADRIQLPHAGIPGTSLARAREIGVPASAQPITPGPIAKATPQDAYSRGQMLERVRAGESIGDHFRNQAKRALGKMRQFGYGKASSVAPAALMKAARDAATARAGFRGQQASEWLKEKRAGMQQLASSIAPFLTQNLGPAAGTAAAGQLDLARIADERQKLLAGGLGTLQVPGYGAGGTQAPAQTGGLTLSPTEPAFARPPKPIYIPGPSSSNVTPVLNTVPVPPRPSPQFNVGMPSYQPPPPPIHMPPPPGNPMGVLQAPKIRPIASTVGPKRPKRPRRDPFAPIAGGPSATVRRRV